MIRNREHAIRVLRHLLRVLPEALELLERDAQAPANDAPRRRTQVELDAAAEAWLRKQRGKR